MAKAIMIQGTMSNAGKSLVAAGLCRIFKQDGFKVAPFKSQNMALNSFITKEGLEMGRAQVMQAEAAGIDPDVRMNPILLKPTNEMGSQVIVNGEVLSNMRAKDYFAFKKQLIPDIMRAYHSLEEDFDIIVIEGAGSPAEINLKKDDIVNMGMAKLAKAPVLLVGDIDRGGVFAQLYGTIMLLEEEEKNYIKGMIVNKFRGDESILEPGIQMLEDRCKKEVIGVVPYMQVQVEDEDSLSEQLSMHHGKQDDQIALIDIVVIQFPRISNFTDFNILMQIPGVALRFVTNVKEMGNPDMIILPGSKNTMKDLLWMRQNGLEALLLKQEEKGSIIFGICGGFQMLGERIEDPHGVEEGGTIKGIGLLPMETIFAGEKRRTRITGTIHKITGVLKKLENLQLEGYEIHMGQSLNKETEGAYSMNQITNEITQEKSLDGLCRGNIYGSYIHGFFDHQDIAYKIVECIAEKKGITMDTLQAFDYKTFKESQYDLLAKTMREHLDMNRIYEILEQGI